MPIVRLGPEARRAELAQPVATVVVVAVVVAVAVPVVSASTGAQVAAAEVQEPEGRVVKAEAAAEGPSAYSWSMWEPP